MKHPAPSPLLAALIERSRRKGFDPYNTPVHWHELVATARLMRNERDANVAMAASAPTGWDKVTA